MISVCPFLANCYTEYSCLTQCIPKYEIMLSPKIPACTS